MRPVDAPRTGTQPGVPAHSALVSTSRELILAQQAPTGAYPACEQFAPYRGYSWLRDGSFTAEGMSRQGEPASATAFHDWCARTLTSHGPTIEALLRARARGEEVRPSDMMPTRFTLEGEDRDEGWWDFQLDGYGTWLWALTEHLARHRLDPAPYAAVVRLVTEYLAAFWSMPCFDWWEEHADRVHVATLGSIVGGLRSAIALDVLDPAGAERASAACRAVELAVAASGTSHGHLTKWLGSSAVDGSLLACVVPFALADLTSPVGRATVAEVESQLGSGGGLHRHLDDSFYGGGRWPLLAGFLGWAHVRGRSTGRAWECLDWMAAQAVAGVGLPEQVEDRLLAPDRLDEWLERWGPSATPLLWSHGMYLILADELGVHGERPSPAG